MCSFQFGKQYVVDINTRTSTTQVIFHYAPLAAQTGYRVGVLRRGRVPGSTLNEFLRRIQEVIGRGRTKAADGECPEYIFPRDRSPTEVVSDVGKFLLNESASSVMNGWQSEKGNCPTTDGNCGKHQLTKEKKIERQKHAKGIDSVQTHEDTILQYNCRSLKDNCIPSPEVKAVRIWHLATKGQMYRDIKCPDGDMVVFGAVETADVSLLCIVCAYAKTLEHCHNILKLCNVITEIM